MTTLTSTAPGLVLLRNGKNLTDYSLRAKDGGIGRVKDLYFDDQHWHLRYFVVDAGGWLDRRQVLISPEAVQASEWSLRELPVKLTKEEVRRSPPIDTDKPVSRQHEAELREHYGWPPYWGVMFAATTPFTPLPRAVSPPGQAALSKNEDPHLRSLSEILGDRVEATDGEIGHVEDLLIDEKIWSIRYLIVNTRHWWPGKKVLISPWWISAINWAESKVVTDLTRAAIKGSPAYDPSQSLTVDHAGQLHDYYGRPRYSDWGTV